MLNRKSRIRNRECAFTLVEILVAVGVFAILGTALVGLMSAAVDAWRQGEASRQVNEKLQALRRQVADDFTAAVVDQPPTSDFHYALDTLRDLPSDPDDPNDPFAILDPNLSSVDDYVREKTDQHDLTYFAPTAASGTGAVTVVLRIRVPFLIGAALLQARLDVLDAESSARLVVARNDPSAEDPAQREAAPPADDPAWKQADYLEGEGIGGAETDISAAVQGGNIVFIKAILDSQSAYAAQFLRGDGLRAGGRPVLILDCYRDPKALPRHPRPTFAAWFKDGAQIITFTRTLPLDVERAAMRSAGPENSAEYLNHADDDHDGQIDEEHRPAAGRAQVVYRVRPYHVTMGKPGLGVLRRALEAPLRHTPSGAPVPDRLDPNVVRLVDDIPDHTFIPNVLHLGVAFWGAETETWELRPDLAPGYDPAKPVYPPSTRWLSSRYLPEQVQVTVCLEPDRGKRITTALSQRLAADFPTSDPGRLYVHNTRGFDNIERPSDRFVRDPRHYVKVNDEWIFYNGVASPTEFIIHRAGLEGLAARGTRGTKVSEHAGGSEVYRGIAAVFTVGIPTFRHWGR